MVSTGFPQKMILLDCETTGGNAFRDRLTEVALIELTDGVETDRWQTLINPEIMIPPWISNLTGITDVMVASQPTFADIAQTLLEKLNDKVFVAHHVRFDYSFIRAAFRRIGLNFSAKKLCSVKLSRRLYPHERRHGIDAIVSRLGLTIQNRHRAMDDAEVILRLFEQASADFSAEEIKVTCKALMQQTRLPSHLDPAEIDKLPEAPGIYQFFDEQGALLYIGKSINIQQRVLSHFNNTKARSSEMQQQLHHIDFTETPTDFGAQLLENTLIKTLNPLYNRRQTKAKRLYQLALSTDKAGYQRVTIEMADCHQPPQISQRYGLFRSQKQAQTTLLKLAESHQLCQQLVGLESPRKGACFGFQLKKCRGACCEKEPAILYNLRLQTALHGLKNQQWPWAGPILVTENALDNDPEKSIHHLIDHWLYLGAVRDVDQAWQKLQQQHPDQQFFDLDAYKIQIRFLLKRPRGQLYIHVFDPLYEGIQ